MQLLRVLCLTLVLCFGAPGPGTAQTIRTDVNILTAIDFSDSVSLGDLRMQIGAIADAVKTPEFMASVREGRHQRIGFAVYVWYHPDILTVQNWQTIATKADAEDIARQMEAWKAQDLIAMTVAGKRFPGGRYTNIAKALDEASNWLDAAPIHAEREVVNVIGNGRDNVYGDVAGARDLLLGSGVTINGLVTSGLVSVARYFSREVVGGAGSFVMIAPPEEDMLDVMLRKFRRDMIAAVRARPTAG